jgi:hypothetical protein
MSFWAGVVQGVKDVDVLKEKEALAEERKAAADKAEAWQLKVFEYNKSRNEIADAYAASAELRAEAAHNLTQSTGTLALGKAMGSLGGASSGMTPGGSADDVPTVQAMRLGQASLLARIDEVGGLDEMSQADKAFFTPILENSAASYELEKLLAAAVGEDEDLTVQNASQRVRSVAIVAAQGQDAWKAFNKSALEEGWSPEKVLEGLELAKSVNPDFAKLILIEPSSTNLTEEQVIKTFESEIQVRTSVFARANPLIAETPEFKTAKSELVNTNPEIRARGMMALVEMGVGNDWIKDNANQNSALYQLVSPSGAVSPVPLPGVGGGEAPQAYTAQEFISLSPEAKAAMDGTIVVVDGSRMVYNDPSSSAGADQSLLSNDRLYGVKSIEPSAGFHRGEPEGGAYSIPSDNLEYEGGRDQEAPDTGDVADGFAIRTPYTGMSLKDSAAELARLNRAEVTDQDAIDNLIEYMNETWKPEDVRKAFEYIDNQGPLPTPPTSPEAYRPTQMGATELNSPKVRSALDTITAEYVEAKGAPLAPEEELAVGIEAIVEALAGRGMDRGDLDSLILDLQAKHGEDAVRASLDLALNP